jgi:protein SCO1/2
MNLTSPISEGRSSNGRRDWLKWAGGAALVPALAGRAAAAPAAAKAGPRANYFPNVVVQTHEGKKVRFYDDLVHGKIVVFNMMYTVCTGICPANTANLLQVQQALGDRLGKDIFMYSMTLQPQFDDPKALREYMQRYGIKPGWTFLTGEPGEMDVLRRKMGFFDSDPALDADLKNHTGMVRVGHERLDRWFMVPAVIAPWQIARAILEL